MLVVARRRALARAEALAHVPAAKEPHSRWQQPIDARHLSIAQQPRALDQRRARPLVTVASSAAAAALTSTALTLARILVTPFATGSVATAAAATDPVVAVSAALLDLLDQRLHPKCAALLDLLGESLHSKRHGGSRCVHTFVGAARKRPFGPHQRP